MDSSIVKGFQNLKVLASFDFHKMDQLVQDLTIALEESAKTQNADAASPQLNHRKQVKKKRSKKRKPDGKAPGGNISEASESSIDEALKDYMENVTQQSDSDDFILVRQLGGKSFPMPSTHSISVVESDSFTENFSPMRPHRRRRRFKRMAVDPQPSSDLVLEDIIEKQKRVKPKVKTEARPLVAKNNMDIDSNQLILGLAACDTLPGKRKRGVREKAESLDADDGTEDTSEMCQSCQSDEPQKELVLESSSSLSSSESDVGLFTNDEGQEGDDEQSDFFHEPGPACGIPGIIPWWEKEKQQVDSEDKDPSFQRILNGSFELMTLASQRSFKSRIRVLERREIRSGRRRIKDRRQGYSVARFLQERQQWKDTGVPGCASGNGNSGDTKRFRKTPPCTPSAGFVGENAAPLSEDSVGGRLLQGMGWTPGSGLGSDGSGITAPIMAYIRPHRQGLGMDHSAKT